METTARAIGSIAAFIAVFGIDPVALGSPDHIAGYRVASWRDADGLPQNSVTAISQDPSGFLWVATFGGLARFDGRTFERFDLTSGMRTPRALDIRRGPDGLLYVGLQERGLQVVAGDRVRSAPPAMALDRRSVDRIFVSGRTIYIRSKRALRVWTSTAWRDIGEVTHAVEDGQGGLWVTTEQTLFKATVDGVVRILDLEPDDRFGALGFTEDGVPWTITRTGLHRLAGTELVHVLAFDGGTYAVGPVFDAHGGAWFAVDDQLFRHPDASVLANASAPVDDGRLVELSIDAGVVRIFEDRERNVWIGTRGAGLWRFTAEPFEIVDAEAATAAVVETREGIAFAGECDRYSVLQVDGTLRREVVDGCIGAMAYDAAADALWICATGLTRYQGGSTKSFDLPECTALHVDARGRVWAGTRADGLFRVDEQQTLSRVDADVVGRVSLLVNGPDGRLWVGEEGRIVVIGAGESKVLDSKSGVPPGQVRTIHFDRGRTFVGTYGGGLAVIEGGRAHHFGTNEGLLDNFISFVTTDANDNVWVSTNRGLHRIPRSDFSDVATGARRELRPRVLLIGETEGGPSPRGLLREDQLWIPTIRGIAKVDVDAMIENRAPPIAVIRSATVDDRPIGSGASVVPPRRGELRIRFAAALLRAPGLSSFQYRLAGVDDDWRRVAERRDVVYDRLAPGRYRFALRAVNEDLVVGPEVSLAFVLEPHLLQTNWFRGGLAVCLLLVAWTGQRLRTRSRRAAQEALREREMHYRRVFEASVNGFFVIDERRRIVDANPAVLEMFGYEMEQIAVHDVETVLDAAPSPSEAPNAYVCRRRDGTTFEARIRESQHPLANAERTLITVVDLSPFVEAQAEKQRLHDQLLHSQRVEAMGRLAGGIAHDVNNMLTAVRCHADLALEALDDPESVKEDLAEIQAGIERTTKLTKQLLAFGQQQTADATPVDVAALVRSAVPMLSRLSRDDVKIHLEIDDEAGNVLADPVHLEQVILNLVINATQSMDGPGNVTIGLDELDAAAAKGAHPDADIVGAVVRLTVEDDGSGMPPEVVDRIFEPFFTTKDLAKSSGLGLSVVHGIVAQARGRIFVKSTVGEGTRFDVLFPRSDEAVTTSESDEYVVTNGGLGEELLYCDDDEAARTATARILRRAGYVVRVADGPEQALEHADQMTRVELLVTDVIMPTMNGRQLFERLRERHPALKVLYVSGYAADALGDDADAERLLLHKPYAPEQLLARVRALLDATP